MEYLGFEVGPRGIQASPGKVRAIIEWPRPKGVHDVRSFLGLASYYRRFVRGFSEMARPLTQLTRAGVDWEWSTAQHQAFNRLKLALTTAPVLKLPDFGKQFVVTTDASDAAVGAILEQDFGNGLQPVAFASRKLNGAEMRYSAYERELLGIVWALAQWKHYCRGPHAVIIQTDHAPLRHLPNQASVNSRVWKWISILQGYNLEIRLEMCAGQNLLERERKETRSRLKKIFLFPVFFLFFSFQERVFPLFPIFLWISHPVLRRSFPVFSSFHLSKPVPCFLMGLNLAI